MTIIPWDGFYVSARCVPISLTQVKLIMPFYTHMIIDRSSQECNPVLLHPAQCTKLMRLEMSEILGTIDFQIDFLLHITLEIEKITHSLSKF